MNAPIQHEIAIMGQEGDVKKTWNPQNPAEVEDARRSFNELKAKGYTAFRVNEKNGESTGEIIREFDPNAVKMILSPQMQGG